MVCAIDGNNDTEKDSKPQALGLKIAQRSIMLKLFFFPSSNTFIMIFIAAGLVTLLCEGSEKWNHMPGLYT